MNRKKLSVKVLNSTDYKMKYYFLALLSLLLVACKSSPKFMQCDKCNGEGKILTECDECNGYGYFKCYECSGSGVVACDNCARSGRTRCNVCRGTGWLGNCIYCSASGYGEDGFNFFFVQVQEKTDVIHVRVVEICTAINVAELVY